jgi:hypothetical protein
MVAATGSEAARCWITLLLSTLALTGKERVRASGILDVEDWTFTRMQRTRATGRGLYLYPESDTAT